ncbi:universal stress protein [Amycolatopsis rhabdoformis]|uniref:Universal stress protein n=1 Tax=Amycolatopsis rhabdoformis TaxID=1448059 RepID=A0ABZ1ICI4_9PSEU|nr:universal stress protein [Amycolatopsis rhabdoformis]WSE32176.1 universal stress protein [Amycolatopsis rhabdoformis]
MAGIDASEAALAAVRWAAAEAWSGHRRLVLFHAGIFDDADLVRGTPTEETERLLERAHRWIRRAAQVAEATAPGVATEYLIRLGLAGELLVGLSEEAALLVLGSHGIGGLRGVAVGSVALRVAANARCPVVVVRGRVKPDGPVAVGVSGAGDERVLEFAFAAARSRHVQVVVVHAWHESLLEEPEALDAEAESEAEALSRRVEDLSGRYPGVLTRTRAVRDRSAARALQGVENAQLIVIGTRGRGPVGGGLFGSTGNRLLSQSSCPVAVVH